MSGIGAPFRAAKGEEPSWIERRQAGRRTGVYAAFLILAAIFLPALFSFAAGNADKSSPIADIPPWIRTFIARQALAIEESGQLVFALNQDPSSSRVTIYALERVDSAWRLAFPATAGSIGAKGFAATGRKREGDGKTPTGIFLLGTAFGYDPSVPTRMPYRQATDNDFWVDDVHSKDYNRWVQGLPDAASWERMRRNDDLYRYGLVIEYNTNPVVKGKGSAIFLHVWIPGESTSGCVSVPEALLLKILGWLDPVRRPLMIMGTESELGAMTEAAGPPPDLVNLTDVNPRIIVDMRYAREDNFTKRKLYGSNTCFLRSSTARKLDAVQKELEKRGLGLKVWDCYRPLAVQRIFWQVLPDERYVANPQKGSRHNRASAVDLTLVDSRGKELQMPTGFDDFSPRAHHRYQDLPDQAIRNRELLRSLMEKEGFVSLPDEWWHYDDESWAQFGLTDLPFEDLLRQRP